MTNLLALIETWIRPDGTGTPAALSTNFLRRGVEVLVSSSPTIGNLILYHLCDKSPFELHLITITRPIKIHFVVVYWPNN